MTTKALTLPEVANQISSLFERMMMLQELTRMAIESLPNSTDSDVPIALLNGMKDILGNDTAKAYRLSEEVETMNDEVSHKVGSARAMTTATPVQLREAITEIDGVAHHVFSEIASMAELALASLETPEAYSNLDSIATVLTSIFNKALNADNHIDCRAEGVACNYKDQAQERRWDAQRKADEATTRGRA